MAKQVTNTVKFSGRQVTRAAVESAMAECDAMGQAAFLDHYGFGRSRRYWLRGETSHRPYPSKAILCVAAGLTKRHGVSNQRVFGGVAATVRVLNQLGFEVREGNEPIRSAGVDALREAAVAAGFNDPAPSWDSLPVTPAATFASGSNTVGSIRGMAAARMDVGVAAPEVRAASEAALLALAGTDVQVFVDSGAFSEVKWNAERFGFDVVKEITDAEWQKRLALYGRLAAGLGEQVWLVAPDQVGSQAVTLERLARYSGQLQKLADQGATIMVVAQKGELGQAEFWTRAVEAAGLTGRPNVVAALPCKKAATTAAEVARFVSETEAPHVHLLGKGPTARDVAGYLAPFAADGVTKSVSLDSCWITANVGRKNGLRRYTKAQDFAARALVAAGRIAEVASRKAADVALKLEVALMLCLGAPLPTLVVEGQQLTLWAA
jgi:hypothetical protein